MSNPVRPARGTHRRDATIDLDDQRRRRRGGRPDHPTDPGPCGAAIDPRWVCVRGPGDGRPVLASLTSLTRGTWAEAEAAASGRVLGVAPRPVGTAADPTAGPLTSPPTSPLTSPPRAA